MTEIKKEYVVIPLKSLVEYERNNKKHGENVTDIQDSIDRNGYITPIIIDENNVILAGHGRKKALELGSTEEVEVIRVTGMTNKQKADFRITDNRLTKLGKINLKNIEFDVKELQLEDVAKLCDISLLPEIEEQLREEGEDNIPGVRGKYTIVKKGDVFHLGEHILVCGDCTEGLQGYFLENTVDLLVTDPPYNVDYTGKGKEALTIENDSMEDSDFRNFLAISYKACDTIMKPGAGFYIRHADSEGYNFRGAAHDIGRQIRQCLIRVKQTMVLGRQDYHRKHEPCLYGRKDGGSHNRYSDRKQTTVLEFDRPLVNKEHPTMKPVSLMEYLIGNNTKQGEVVLDPFLGSGTTMIACEKTNRKCYRVELDPKYIQVILKRYYDYTGGEKAIKCMNRELDLSSILKGKVTE